MAARTPRRRSLSANRSPQSQRFVALRQSIITDDRLSAHERRLAITNLADASLTRFFSQAPSDVTSGVALVAVGGYGRQELLPGSDLDVLLLVDDRAADPAAIAEKVFYPVWDAGIALDHAVRSRREALTVAADDLKVALGLIDARHVTGDSDLTERLVADARAAWRKQASSRLPELASMCRERAEQFGELAHLLEPDLVHAYGGLRDTLALRAVAASWIADPPHTSGVGEAREWLLAVRDALHRATRRGRDKLLFDDQADVAELLGLAGPEALLRRVAEAGRRIAYASDVTWRAVERTLAARRPLRRRQVTRRPLAEGVVEQDGEAVLAHDADLDGDPVLPLRTAAAAAQAGLTIGPQTVSRLAKECPALPQPWPDEARDSLISLLGAGHAAVPVWDSLDAAGLITGWFPEWEQIRYRPTRTPIHRHTVDRHLIETAAVATGFTRRVARPDILLLASLLHDIGKGTSGPNHPLTGAGPARRIGLRLGLTSDDADVLARLVRHHLLLPEVATRRDPDDPATLATVVNAVESRDFLELLAALTEADATAAGPIAWSPLRSSLVRGLVERVADTLNGRPPPEPAVVEPWQAELAKAGRLAVRLDQATDTDVRVSVSAPDTLGLLAMVAGVLALHGLRIRTASVRTLGPSAVLVSHVITRFGPPPEEQRLRQDIRRVVDGSLDLQSALSAKAAEHYSGRTILHAQPRVSTLAEASRHSTVLEVRTHDESGLLFRLANVIADCGAIIRSAVVETMGAEAIDVFYLVDSSGAPLSRDDQNRVVSAVSDALSAVPDAH